MNGSTKYALCGMIAGAVGVALFAIYGGQPGRTIAAALGLASVFCLLLCLYGAPFSTQGPRGWSKGFDRGLRRADRGLTLILREWVWPVVGGVGGAFSGGVLGFLEWLRWADGTEDPDPPRKPLAVSAKPPAAFHGE